MKMLIPLACAALLAATAGASSAQTVTPATAAQVKKAVAAQKGRPTIVNVWATWCVPCVEEMPALAKLQKAYAGRASLLLVSADDKGIAQSGVKSFLKKHGLQRSYIIEGSMARWGDAFAPGSGALALPKTFVFDKSGKMVSSFSGARSYAQWQAILKPLLK